MALRHHRLRQHCASIFDVAGTSQAATLPRSDLQKRDLNLPSPSFQPDYVFSRAYFFDGIWKMMPDHSRLNGGFHASRQNLDRDSRGCRRRCNDSRGGAVRGPGATATAPFAHPGHGTPAPGSRSRHRKQAQSRILSSLPAGVRRVSDEEFHVVYERPLAAILARSHAVPDVSGFARVLQRAVGKGRSRLRYGRWRRRR
jgi:hypothetical protein